MKKDIIIAGVGGQGILSIAAIIGLSAVNSDLFLKQAEVHGMAQRGGSVNSHVRWGERVRSPVIGRSEADVMIALEKLEALRYISMLRPGGTVLVRVGMGTELLDEFRANEKRHAIVSLGVVAASLVLGSEVTVEGVGLNATRTGLLDVLAAMGADVTLRVELLPASSS